MIVLDTSGLLAALDATERLHDRARAVLESDSGPYALSPFVLAELDYLLATRVSTDAQLALLAEVEAGSYWLVPFVGEDVGRSRIVVERYRNLDVGLADASIVVLAENLGTRRVLTLDERHFRALRTERGESFELLPADC